MKRRRIGPRDKAAIRDRQDDACAICGEPLGADVEYDHHTALIHDGADSLDNLRAVHGSCHKGKTAADVAANAKVKRIIRKRDERARGVRNAKQRALEKLNQRRI